MTSNGKAFRTLALPALALVAGVSGAPRADDDSGWVEVRTEHFIVRTDAERGRAEALATDLEKYRHTIGYLAGLDTRNTPSVPVTVYAWRRYDDYIDETGAFGTAGFYVARPAGPVSLLSLEDGEEDWELSGKRVLFHEYTHHILHQLSPIEYPRWYDEGFAEYMATIEFDGDHAVIGKPALHRMPYLKRVRDWLRAFELIDSRGRYLGHIGTSMTRDPRRGRGGQSMQYAQGWLMVHYLHSEPGLQRGIPRYLAAINRADVDDEQAFEDAFGMDYREFDRAVKDYWNQKQFATGRVEIASRLPEIAPEVREMDACEAEAAAYEALALTGNFDSINNGLVRKRFGACLERGVRERDMRLVLFELALDAGEWSRAAEHVEALLAADADDAAAVTASVRLARSRTGEMDPETAAELRGQAIRAIMAEPTYVPALLEYADLTFEHELPVDDNVVSVIDSIRFLAPDLNAGKIFEARLFAGRGAQDEALALIDEMIKWSGSTDEELELKELRREIAEGAQG